MRKVYGILSLLVLVSLYGCDLSAPPSCMEGSERCEYNNVVNSALYSVCTKEGNWELKGWCAKCNEDSCEELMAVSCSEESDKFCLNTQNMSISFDCSDGIWIPTLCIGDELCNDETGLCNPSKAGCKEGSQMCVWVEALGYSLQSTCTNNQWISTFCPPDVDCNESQTACLMFDLLDAPCSGQNGDACTQDELLSGWSSGTCEDNQCTLLECLDGYTKISGRCVPSAECCGHGCINCTDKGLSCSSSDVDEGSCVSECPSGKVNCSGVCVDPMTSHEYCGVNTECKKAGNSESTACHYNLICKNGTCECKDENSCFTGDECVDFSTSSVACGALCINCNTLTNVSQGDCISGNCFAVSCGEHYTTNGTVCCEDRERMVVLRDDSYVCNYECDETHAECDGDINTSCETDLMMMNWTECQVCDESYMDCDNDSSNGCEKDVGVLHLKSCLDTDCAENYYDCNDELVDGCETYIDPDLHMKSCTECAEGYGDCNDDISDGCEYVFAEGMNRCGGCTDGLCYVDGTCQDNKTTVTGCGNDCINCNKVKNTVAGICTDGTCHATECAPGYTSNGRVCCQNRLNGSVVQNNNDTCSYQCDDGYVDNGGKCDFCVNGQTKCENDDVNGKGSTYECVDGNWVITACGDKSCTLEGTCGECVDGNTSCTTNSSNVGKIKTCTNGKYGNETTCKNSYSCKSNGTTCGSCQNNKTRCSGLKPQSCTKGVWKSSAECTTSVEHATATCSSGECGFECNDDYCLSSDKSSCLSIQSDLNHCGACGNVCNVANATAMKCESGVCKATKCANNYVLLDGRCEEKVCTEGATKCANDGTTGKMYKCISNAWVEQSTCSNNYSCKSDGKTCGSCVDGKTSCSTDSNNIGQIKTCSNGVWGTEKACSNNYSCKSSTACGKCQDGKTTCSEDSSGEGSVKTCSKGAWGTAQPCSDSHSCNSDNSNCGECQNGKTSCSDSNKIGQLKTCTDGAWGEAVACSSNYSCKSTSECGSCQNGKKSCSTNSSTNIGSIKTCSNGVWGTPSACSNNYSCKSSTACGSCVNNQTKCTNTGTTGSIQTCTKGAWGTASTCTNNNSCKSDGKTCGDCINDKTKCTNSGTTGSTQTCTDGEWGTSTKCTNNYSCNSTNTACGSCVNNKVKCTNSSSIGKVSTCKSGAWAVTTDCKTTSCSGSACGECKNSATKCTDSGTTGQLQTCDSGKWGDAAACTSNYSCKSSSACGSCINGKKRCYQTTNTQTCKTGKWGTTTACTVPANGSATCSSGTCGISCNDGYCVSGTTCVSTQTNINNCGSCGTKCTKAKVAHSTSVKCSAGTCVATACEDGYSLISGKCEVTVCTAGETRCINSGTTGKMQKCVSNKWQDQSTCSNKYSCNSAGTACGECVNGNQTCSNNSSNVGSVKTCTDGAWGTATKCSGNVSCKGNACGDCKNNTKSCTNSSNIGAVKTCSGGQWGSAVSCNTVSCNSARTDCGECQNDSPSCTNNSSNIGQLKVCSDGAWGAESACPGNHSCRSAGYCGVCQNGSPSCTNDSNNVGQLKICSNGEWGTESACSGNHSCRSSGYCGDCRNGDKKCKDSHDAQICESGEWKDNTCFKPPSHGSSTCSGAGSCGWSCDANYCPVNSLCEYHNLQTEVEHCGTCGHNCNKMPGVSAATCNSGSCYITRCMSGLYPYDNVACISELYNCGSQLCSNTYCSENCVDANNYYDCHTKNKLCVSGLCCVDLSWCNGSDYMPYSGCVFVHS